MGNQGPPLPPRRHGGECLPNLARYLSKGLVEHDVEPRQPSSQTLDAAARANTGYVLVHVYLVPGDATTRVQLRDAIHQELTRQRAEQLHDLAYAVPAARDDGRMTAEDTWNALMQAGAIAVPGNQDAWDAGDVVYVHYWTYDGFAVLAGAPRAGHRLPQAAQP